MRKPHIPAQRPRKSSIDRLRRLRAGIKAAWKQTGQDDATYRQMLQQVAGVNTSLALTLETANRVLDHINGHLGRTATKPHQGKPDRVRKECTELLAKIEALLADMKLPWGYGLTILKHQGIDAWGFTTAEQMAAVIAALAIEQAKRQREARVVQALAALGRDRATAQTIARALGSKRPANWHRDLGMMDRMLAHLANLTAAKEHA